MTVHGGLSFADWQRSRGIPGWDWIHAMRNLRNGIIRLQVTFADAMAPVFALAADVLSDLARHAATEDT